jgi:LAO/AO transport system kinase
MDVEGLEGAEALVDAARNGNRRSLARVLSAVEDGSGSLRGLLAHLGPTETDAHIIGITGSPGVGKSSFTTQLVSALRARNQRVAVLAVDPSSPFSGGAILGDRVRMQEHAMDPGVYIRSMASRGHLGGLSAATPQALRVLSAVGFDVVIVETVGVGQSEVEVAAAADTTLVLVAPGMGDGIQAVKAGIAEIGDILVVNKADRDGADTAVRDLRHAISLAEASQQDWAVPIHKVISTRGDGIDVVLQAIDSHREWLATSGERQRRRVHRAKSEIVGIVMGLARQRLDELGSGQALTQAATAVAGGASDPFTAADELLAALTSGTPGA